MGARLDGFGVRPVAFVHSLLSAKQRGVRCLVGAWVVFASTMLACGGGGRGTAEDASRGDFVDEAWRTDDGRSPDRPQDWLEHAFGEVSELDLSEAVDDQSPWTDQVETELADVMADETAVDALDGPVFPPEPVLCGYQLKPGEYAFGNPYHRQVGLEHPADPAQKAETVAFYPKRMWLLPD